MVSQAERLGVRPQFSKGEVNSAAKAISKALAAGAPVPESAEEKVENWRGAHAHILLAWATLLRNRIKKQKTNILFAQRLKRKNTIYDKLKRLPDMRFTQMQDIAGCRLIFKNENDLFAFRESLHQAKFKHTLKDPGKYNYIASPKASGYRGIHDVYEWQSDSNSQWNGLLVEIQYRTVYQHAWATAVEVADNITKGRIKYSEDLKSRQEFFALASEIIARAFENQTSCRASLNNLKVIENFEKIEQKIHLFHQLKTIAKIDTQISGKNLIIHYLKVLNSMQPKNEFYPFSELEAASDQYFEYEKENKDDDIVLVSGDSPQSIQKAFQNYFADTQDFVQFVQKGLQKLRKQK